MQEILPVFCLSLILAYCSQKNIFNININKTIKLDGAFIALVITLSVFCGLRIDYNDTHLYVYQFKHAVTLNEYISTSPGFFDNPLFYSFQSFFSNNVINNAHVYLLTISFFVNFSILRFIKRYSDNFLLSIVIFFAIGLYYDFMGAMKQTIAIAVLTYAINAFINKKLLRYLVLVIVATLIHSYAIFFLILPLLKNRPWTINTYITVFMVIALLLTFESTLNMIMSAAEDAGKNLAEEEMKDNIGINPFRLMVFAIPPLLTFIFQERLNPLYDRTKSTLMNMGIFSFLIMCMGIFTAANMFGRCAGYFELGSIILLPWIIDQIFDKESVRFASVIVGLCYFGFFIVESQGFDNNYASIGIGQFFMSL